MDFDKTKILKEADLIKKRGFEIRLVDVFSGDAKGRSAERKDIEGIKSRLKDEIYTLIIYLISGQMFDSLQYSKKIFLQIQKHEENLNKKLKRKVGIRVASIDYLGNILPTTDSTKIIEKTITVSLSRVKDLTVHHDNSIVDIDKKIKGEYRKAMDNNMPLSIISCELSEAFDDLHDYNSKILNSGFRSALQKAIRSNDGMIEVNNGQLICLLPEADSKSAVFVGRRICRSFNENNHINTIAYLNLLSLQLSLHVIEKNINIFDILTEALSEVTKFRKVDVNRLTTIILEKA